jgi:hypothetical protein
VRRRAQELFDDAMNNSEFIKTIEKAEDSGISVPGIDTPPTRKALFATLYFGWLLANYGNKWNENQGLSND